MATVGVLVHEAKPEAVALGDSTTAWLRERGHDVRRAGEQQGEDSAWARGLDLALSLGGDGTMLRTVHRAAPHDVPVLGVNVGRLGYLTAVEPDGLEDALDRFFAGNHQIEERMRLSAVVESADGERRDVALNEAVVEKAVAARTVRLAVHIAGNYFTTYEADGVIVGTPTGSTAYVLSARGPIVAPRHRALLLTPVAPHMLFDRTLVLEPDEEVRIEVAGPRPAAVAVDGRDLASLAEGDAVVCTAAERPARLVTFGGADFHDILKAKFGLNER